MQLRTVAAISGTGNTACAAIRPDVDAFRQPKSRDARRTWPGSMSNAAICQKAGSVSGIHLNAIHLSATMRTGWKKLISCRRRLFVWCKRGRLVEQARHCRDDLCGRKWLVQEDTVWHPVRSPLIGRGTGHVNDWNFRIDLSGSLGHLPAAELAGKIDVRDDGPIGVFAVRLQELQGFLARCDNLRLKAAFGQSVAYHNLDKRLVFNDQDND